MSLRSRTIRLASSNAELRPHLLKVLKQAYGGTYVEVSKLPLELKQILKKVFGFKRASVEVISSATVHTGGASFEGNRSKMILINLGTWAYKELRGSWGGANPFESKPIDQQAEIPIPPNSAVISGEAGGRGTFARIYIHPSNMSAMIDGGEKLELSEEQKYALGSFSLKGGQYRRDHFARHHLGEYGPANEHIVALAQMGLLKITGAGPSITAEGRNMKNTLGYSYQG